MFRSARRPPVLSSPALLRRPAEFSTSVRLGSAQTFLRGGFLFAPLCPALCQILIRPPQAAAELVSAVAPAFRSVPSRPAVALAATGTARSASFRRLLLSSCSCLEEQRSSLLRSLHRPGLRRRAFCSAPLGALQYQVLRPSCVVPQNLVLTGALRSAQTPG